MTKGIEKSALESLDIRHNLFDSVGLAALINALSKKMTIRELYLESMHLQMNDAKLLAAFFER